MKGGICRCCEREGVRGWRAAMFKSQSGVMFALPRMAAVGLPGANPSQPLDCSRTPFAYPQTSGNIMACLDTEA
jgi:hypothetical protein